MNIIHLPILLDNYTGMMVMNCMNRMLLCRMVQTTMKFQKALMKTAKSFQDYAVAILK